MPFKVYGIVHINIKMKDIHLILELEWVYERLYVKL